MSDPKEEPLDEQDTIEIPSVDEDSQSTQVDEVEEVQALVKKASQLSVEDSKEPSEAQQQPESTKGKERAPEAEEKTQEQQQVSTEGAAAPAPRPKTVVIMRGVPGSGKSTLSKSILEKAGGEGIVCTSDDFFMRNGKYVFNPSLLSDAHAWNQRRVADALRKGIRLVIVDNTHTQKWEARPYVVEALKYGYQVKIAEPNTAWKTDPAELAKRNVHGVPVDAIQRMLDRWETDFTVEAILQARRK